MNCYYFLLIVLFLIIIILIIFNFFRFNDIDIELCKKIKSEKYTGDYKIPRILHQIYTGGYDKIIPSVKKVIKENLDMNPNWEYRFYDNEKIDKYIKEYESEYVYNAYKKINPRYCAVIADLFRYIVMYHEGGVYIDIKSKTNIPLDNWVHKDKLQLSLSSQLDLYLYKYFKDKLKNIGPRQFQQHTLIYPKKHYILRILIDTICNNIYKFNNNKIFFLPRKQNNIWKVFNLSGPWIYTKILSQYVINNWNSCKIYNLNSINGHYNGYILYDGTDGEYHNHQRMNKIYYLDLNEKIIL